MDIPISELAQHGLIKDTPAVMVPLGAFTGCKNVEFREGYVVTRPRPSALVVPAIAPLSLFPAVVESTALWTICGKAKVYGFDGTTQADITRVSADYTLDDFDSWQGGMFNSYLVLNNGVDVPQVWGPVSLSQKLVDLPAWTSGMKAKVVVGFKSTLVAINVTKTGGADSRMVKWSHPADPSTLPVTWDETDPIYEAGEISLNDADDGLVDGVGLGDALVLYTRSGAWLMRYVGGTAIYDFTRLPFSFGVMTQGAVAKFPGGHFIVTPDDFVVHDGSEAKSVASGSVKRFFRSSLYAQSYFLTRAVALNREHQIWVIFPTANTEMNTVLVWNWETGVWTLHEFDGTVRALGVSQFSFSYSFRPWSSLTGSWAAQTWQWGGETEALTTETMLVSPMNMDGISKIVDGGGEVCDAEVERTDIINITSDSADALAFKRIFCIRPLLEAEPGEVFQVYVGGRNSLSEEVVWKAPVSFTVGTDVEAHVDATYRFLAYKITSSSSSPWKLVAISLDIRALKEQR